ncbi:DGC domain protein [Ruminiclostridium hungatei]|uniref:DGC domain protein n=2 Tax=Ruminiclostridium hungatei TaxID=48256 RepID=A0A1V4SKA6_RUMHU|nr:DGC domain protein [Ruminiclostridium hungatei]
MGCCSLKTEGKKRIVYTCSGCCDLGKTSDLLGRKLREEGMALSGCSCLAGIAADIPDLIETAKTADEIICIDGCELSCATRVIEKINIHPKTYILTEYGLKGGNFDVSEKIIDELYSKIFMELKG